MSPFSKGRTPSGPGRHATPLSLRRNFSWTFASNMISGACQWAMLAALAKLVSPTKVGEYAYALSIASPVFLFAGLSLSQVEATDAKRTNTFAEYLGLRLITLILAFVGIGGIAAIIHPSREIVLVLVMVTGIKTFDALSDIMFGLQRQHERMDYMAISCVGQAVLQLVLLTSVVWLTRSIVWGAGAIAAGSGLLTVFYDTRMTARIAAGPTRSVPSVRALFRPAWHFASLWPLARLSLPLGFVAVLGMLNVNIPRYFVQYHIGLRELGIFSAMWSMMHPVGLIGAAVTLAVTPRMVRYYTESISQFKHVLGLLLGLSGVSALVSIVLAHFFGRAILSALFRPAYAEHPVVFEWMMVAAGTIYVTSVLTGAVSAARAYRAQPYIFFSAVLLNAAACWALVPRFGVLGATWAYGVGSTVLMLGFAGITWQAIRTAECREAAALKTSAAAADTAPVQA